MPKILWLISNSSSVPGSFPVCYAYLGEQQLGRLYPIKLAGAGPYGTSAYVYKFSLTGDGENDLALPHWYSAVEAMQAVQQWFVERELEADHD